MSVPTITSQAATRAFAFGAQVAPHPAPENATERDLAASQHTAEGIGCSRAAAVCSADVPGQAFDPASVREHLNPRARDLHQRADLMFRCGYQASGWTLRQAAWRMESAK